MPLLLNKVNRIRSSNYVIYSFNMTYEENIKEKRKIFTKHQANVINVLKKQLLYQILSSKLRYSK